MNGICDSIFLQPTTPYEVSSIVQSLKGNKSARYDDISPYVLKRVIDSIAEPLSIMINYSFTQGVFPDGLKIAKVIPVFKYENKRLVNFCSTSYVKNI